ILLIWRYHAANYGDSLSGGRRFSSFASVTRCLAASCPGEMPGPAGAAGGVGPRVAAPGSGFSARWHLRIARRPAWCQLPDAVLFHGNNAAVLSHGIVK